MIDTEAVALPAGQSTLAAKLRLGKLMWILLLNLASWSVLLSLAWALAELYR